MKKSLNVLSKIVDVQLGSKYAFKWFSEIFGKFLGKLLWLNSVLSKHQAGACQVAASEMTNHDAESLHLMNITYVQNVKGKDNSLFNTYFVI